MLLDYYCLFGCFGFCISLMVLGMMIFGVDWGWGVDEIEVCCIFDIYVECGGNFIDIVNNYINGSVEILFGWFVQGQCDWLVIVSKYIFVIVFGDFNNVGNYCKSMLCLVEDSLWWLGIDYFDLLYLYVWDDIIGVDEVMWGFDDLVCSGKVFYVGILDMLVWQIVCMQILVDLCGWLLLVVLQIEYSLIQCSVEYELLLMVDVLGLGVVVWLLLGSGVLIGKYSMVDFVSVEVLLVIFGGLCCSVVLINGVLMLCLLQIVGDVVIIVVDFLYLFVQVVFVWLLQCFGVGVLLIIGVCILMQFEYNLDVLQLVLLVEVLVYFDVISVVVLLFLYDFLWMLLSWMLMSGGIQLWLCGC